MKNLWKLYNCRAEDLMNPSDQRLKSNTKVTLIKSPNHCVPETICFTQSLEIIYLSWFVASVKKRRIWKNCSLHFCYSSSLSPEIFFRFTFEQNVIVEECYCFQAWNKWVDVISMCERCFLLKVADKVAVRIRHNKHISEKVHLFLWLRTNILT